MNKPSIEEANVMSYEQSDLVVELAVTTTTSP